MTIRLLLTLGLLLAAPAAAPAKRVVADGLDETGPSACYTLEPPGPAWRSLEPSELRTLAPEALAGLAGPRGVKVLLYAGPDKHPELERSLEEVLGGQGLAQTAIAFIEETEVGERRALQGMVNGKRDDLWLRYHAVVFREGPDLYRLVGWGRSDTVPADGSTFQKATAGLRRLEGVTLDLLPRGGRSADADGPGWQIREGIYRDAALGFQLDPRGPWRVALGTELESLATTSHVGLVDEQHDALLAVAVERTHEGIERGPHAERHRRQALGGAYGSGELEIAAEGRSVTLRLATVPAPVGSSDVTRQLAVGVLFDEDLCIQLIARYPAASAELMTKALEQALASLSKIGAQERDTLAAEMLAAPPALDSVGKGWTLRGRTFIDFANGLRWSAPPGFWEVAGRADGAEEDGTLVRFHERESGLHGWIRAVGLNGADAEAWHTAEVERLLVPLQGELSPAVEVQLGEVAGRLAKGKRRDGSGHRGMLASCVRGDTAFSVLLSGSPQELESLSGTPLAVIKALQVSLAPLPPTEMAPGAYVDLRLGFSLASPDDSWSFRESKLDRYGPTAAEADGVVAGFEGSEGRGVFVAAAWTAARSATGDGEPLEPFVPSALHSLANLPDRPADEDIQATLRGRSCRLLSWSESGRRIELALLWRGRTALAVCAVAGAGDPEPRQWLAGFRLLD